MRHGQIKANRVGRWHGSTDTGLTFTGRLQARRAAGYLACEYPDIAAVYASPLKRCQMTASIATRGRDLELKSHPGLAELCIGEWEDMSFRDLHKQHNLINRLTSDPYFRPPGGETVDEVSVRVTEALREIEAAHPGENVLVVSHGVALGIALGTLLHFQPTKWPDYDIDNCSITELYLNPKPHVPFYNRPPVHA